jgi:hypothetical protein
MAPVPTVIVDKPILVCCISTYDFTASGQADRQLLFDFQISEEEKS